MTGATGILNEVMTQDLLDELIYYVITSVMEKKGGSAQAQGCEGV